MRVRFILATLLLGASFGLTALLPLPAADQADADRITRLIAELGSAKFDAREKAYRELEAIGLPALGALRKAAKSGDLETQRRAEELVQKLESRAHNDKLLAASRIRLAYKDTPVLEALADVAKKTGFDISYVGDPESVKGRTLTLDTGATTFWQAFDQFCARARLIEGLPNRPHPGVAQLRLAVAGGPAAVPAAPAQPQPQAGPNTVIPTFGPYRKVTLVDGKPKALPTDYVGAIRVRALAPNVEVLAAPPALEKEVRVFLDVSPEPGVELMRIVELRLDKALDDQGQALKALKVPEPEEKIDPAQNIKIAVRALTPQLGPNHPRQLPVRMEVGQRPSRSLRELKGTVGALVRTPPKELAAVDNLLNAAGKSVKGEHGVTLTVQGVKKLDDGQLELHVLLERPNDVFGHFLPGPAGGVGPAGVQVRPVPIQPVLIQPIKIQIQVQPQQPIPAAPAPPAAPADKAPAPVPNAAPRIPAQPKAQPVPAQALPVGALAPQVNYYSYVGLAVVDAQGRHLPLAVPRMLKHGTVKGIVTQELTLRVKSTADQGEPAKLVFIGNRNVTVEIAFSLKDVPLP